MQDLTLEHERRHCEERSDVAIQRIIRRSVVNLLDCHVAALLAMTVSGYHNITSHFEVKLEYTALKLGERVNYVRNSHTTR